MQVDILSNDDEVQEVVQFVSDNAKRVLNVDTARVIPVSSRLALDAKLAVGDEATGESLLGMSCHGSQNETLSALLGLFTSGQPLLLVLRCSLLLTELLSAVQGLYKHQITDSCSRTGDGMPAITVIWSSSSMTI